MRFVPRAGAAVLLAALAFTGVAPARIAKPVHAATSGALFGLYPAHPALQQGNTGVGIDTSQIAAVNAWQGRNTSVATVWGGLECGTLPERDYHWTQVIPQVWAAGAIPVIAATTPVNPPPGTLDPCLDRFAGAIKSFTAGPDGVYGTADDRRIFIRLDPEINGDWEPQSPAASHPDAATLQTLEEQFQALWAHVWYRVMRVNGLDNTRVAWVFNVNWKDSCWLPGCPHLAEAMYPGDAYVDWVTVDGYNEDGFAGTDPSLVFGDMVSRLRAITTRPLGIAEAGAPTISHSGTTVATVTEKDQYITNFYTYVQSIGAGMVLWWNEDKEEDWGVFQPPDWANKGDSTFSYAGTTYNAYSAYPAAVASSYFVASDAANPRLVGDAQFLGRTPPSGTVTVLHDDLDDFSKMTAHTPNLAIDSTNPQYFNGDTSRLERDAHADDGTLGAPLEFATWATPGATQLVADTYFWPDTTVTDFVFRVSADGATYTTVTPAVDNLGGSWTELRYTVALPPGTAYVQMVFPDVAPTWTPQVSQVTATGPSTTLTDDLYSFDNILENSPSLGIDTTNPGVFAGDTARLTRTSTTDTGTLGRPVEFAVWHLDGMSQFTARTFWWPGTGAGDFAFASSGDGVSYKPVWGVATTDMGGDWDERDYGASLPAGTHYLKIWFPDVAPYWSPQLSQLVLSNDGGTF